MLVIMACLVWMLNYAEFRFCGCLRFSDQSACFLESSLTEWFL